jgi:hypothetical protein
MTFSINATSLHAYVFYVLRTLGSDVISYVCGLSLLRHRLLRMLFVVLWIRMWPMSFSIKRYGTGTSSSRGAPCFIHVQNKKRVNYERLYGMCPSCTPSSAPPFSAPKRTILWIRMWPMSFSIVATTLHAFGLRMWTMSFATVATTLHAYVLFVSFTTGYDVIVYVCRLCLLRHRLLQMWFVVFRLRMWPMSFSLVATTLHGFDTGLASDSPVLGLHVANLLIDSGAKCFKCFKCRECFKCFRYAEETFMCSTSRS